MSFFWYEVAALLVIPATSAGPTEVVGTDTVTLSESAVAELLPVATDSLTVTDAATGQVLAVAVDSSAVSESAVTTLANAVGTTETATVTDALTALLATATATDSGTLSEATALPVDAVASDSGTLSETRAGLADVVAVDAFSVSELATPTSSSGSNITDSDAATVSESLASIPVAVVASESFTVSEAIAPLGLLAQTDSLTLSESASTAADLTGVASYSTLTLTPRLTVNPSAGQVPPTFDSSLITFDSTLFTWDGLYRGEFTQGVGVRERQANTDAGVDGKLAGSAVVEVA